MTAQVGGASLPSSSPSDSNSFREYRKQLRRDMRYARQRVPHALRRRFALQVTQQLLRAGVLRPGRAIGVYLALPEELDLQPTIRRAQSLGCKVFVPHILHSAHARMAFYAYTPQMRLRSHRWGVTQLATIAGRIPVATVAMDVVLVPTVAFDTHGHRLGMGAGFYDRHFARRQHHAWRRPLLIGVAYSFQHRTHIEPQAHDVRLDAVVTERAFIRTRP